jgi:hypothetical protein
MKNRSSGFPMKQDSEIAPRRRRERGVKEFSIKKFSDLCELRAFAVNILQTKPAITEKFRAGQL